jgi:hypothetical protein
VKHSPFKIAMVVLGYLAAGAVVNVVVAWGIAGWLAVPSYKDGWRGQRVPASMHMVLASWPECERAEQGRGFGRTHTTAHFGPQGYFGNEKVLVHMQTGWPMRSMESWLTIDRSEPPLQETRFFGLRTADLPRARPYPETPFGQIPLRPDSPGFVVNTVVWAMILVLLVRGPRWVRGEIRVRRGLCRACGYPIGVADRCTECGRELPRWVVRVRGDSAPAAAMRERNAES